MHRLVLSLSAVLVTIGGVTRAAAVDGPDAVEKLIFTVQSGSITKANDGAVTFLSDTNNVTGSATAPLRATYRGKVCLEATLAPPPGIDNPNFTLLLGTKDGPSIGAGVQLGQGRAWITQAPPRSEILSKDGAPYIGRNEFTVKLELDLAAKKAVWSIKDYRVETAFTADLKAVDTFTVASYIQGIVLREVVLSADTVSKPADPAG